MTLTITKNSQKILSFSHSYLSFSFMLPSFPSPSPASYGFSLSPLACLLDWCCSRQNDITPSLVDCSVRKLNVYMQLYVCTRRNAWDQHPGHEDRLRRTTIDLKNHYRHERLIAWTESDCVCLGQIKTMRGLNREDGIPESRKQTLTILKTQFVI